MLPQVITLTTDFGARDPYVAAMKGVILSRCPGVAILDLTHDIAPQNVVEGALFLAGAAPWFPPGTVHIAVVDPGVGTARRPVAIAWRGQFLVGPDNGLFTLLLDQSAAEAAHVISNPAFILDTVSATFHGRDVFAPAAAALAVGADIAEAGPAAGALHRLPLPKPVRRPDGGIDGEIIHVDRFGNCISNISAEGFDTARPWRVQAGDVRFARIHRTYGDVAPSEALALFGSGGYLEIAVNGGNAERVLGLSRGAPVSLEPA